VNTLLSSSQLPIRLPTSEERGFQPRVDNDISQRWRDSSLKPCRFYFVGGGNDLDIGNCHRNTEQTNLLLRLPAMRTVRGMIATIGCVSNHC
jgi:hypothetical protein